MLVVFTPRCELTSCVHSVARAGFGLPPAGERPFALAAAAAAAALAFFPTTVFFAPGEAPFTLRDPAPFPTTLCAPRFPIPLNPATPQKTHRTPPTHPPPPSTQQPPSPPPHETPTSQLYGAPERPMAAILR